LRAKAKERNAGRPASHWQLKPREVAAQVDDEANASLPAISGTRAPAFKKAFQKTNDAEQVLLLNARNDTWGCNSA
jgi:hypothetical protein